MNGTMLSREERAGLHCPACGSVADREKCFWDQGPSCPRLYAESYDHIIELNDDLGELLGFTSDRFLPMSYLWRRRNTIVISFIASCTPGAGHFSALLDAIWAQGWTVEVPTPILSMPEIVRHKGFIGRCQWDTQLQDWVEIWSKEP